MAAAEGALGGANRRVAAGTAASEVRAIDPERPDLRWHRFPWNCGWGPEPSYWTSRNVCIARTITERSSRMGLEIAPSWCHRATRRRTVTGSTPASSLSTRVPPLRVGGLQRVSDTFFKCQTDDAWLRQRLVRRDAQTDYPRRSRGHWRGDSAPVPASEGGTCRRSARVVDGTTLTCNCTAGRGT